MSTEREIEWLYTLPLAEFTAARNELAKRLRGDGDRAAAERVKTLAKPSVAAWAVNQLFHSEREAFERLLDAGTAQRQALERGSKPRAGGERKRAAINELLRRAQRLLEDAGSKWTPGLRQRVHRTLETLAAQRPSGEAPLGRLTTDLQPAGFDALLGTTIAPAPRRGRAKLEAKSKGKVARPSAAAVRRLEAARARVQSTRGELAAARRKKSAAAKALTRLERQVLEARKKSRAAERRAEQARQRAEELDLQSRRAKSVLEGATSTVARIEARLETESRKIRDLA